MTIRIKLELPSSIACGPRKNKLSPPAAVQVMHARRHSAPECIGPLLKLETLSDFALDGPQTLSKQYLWLMHRVGSANTLENCASQVQNGTLIV